MTAPRAPEPRQWIVHLPYATPPLNANQRLHPQQRGRIVKQLRHDAGWKVRAAGVPALLRCHVELHYVPPDNRRRDADNLAPTLKASCDGIVDAGVVADDVPALMGKGMPVIHPAQRTCRDRLYLVITDLSEVGE